MNLPKEIKKNTCTQKTVRHWWTKMKMTQTDGKLYHVHGLEKLILKWPYSKAIYRFNAIPSKTPIIHRSRTNNFKICMETQRPPNSKNNLEKEEQSRRDNPPRLQRLLQSYSNQNSMVLAQKQISGSMKQKRPLRNKPSQLRSVNFRQRRQVHTMGER